MATQRPKVPRRKAKQERAQDTVAALVEASAQVLLRWGYARATTNRIAEKAGVSIGTVKSYTHRALASLRADPRLHGVLSEEAQR